MFDTLVSEERVYRLGDEIPGAEILADDIFVPLNLEGWGTVAYLVATPVDDPDVRAEIDRLVRACNSFDALLAACKTVLAAIEWSTTTDRMTPEKQATILDAALAAAEGRDEQNTRGDFN